MRSFTHSYLRDLNIFYACLIRASEQNVQVVKGARKEEPAGRPAWAECGNGLPVAVVLRSSGLAQVHADSQFPENRQGEGFSAITTV